MNKVLCQHASRDFYGCADCSKETMKHWDLVMRWECRRCKLIQDLHPDWCVVNICVGCNSQRTSEDVLTSVYVKK
jgi:hypothetical protein